MSFISDVKKEDRTSLSVSKRTRDKVMAYIEERQAIERYRVTQDIVIEEAIECLERNNKLTDEARKTGERMSDFSGIEIIKKETKKPQK